jgi:hypothetical protein
LAWAWNRTAGAAADPRGVVPREGLGLPSTHPRPHPAACPCLQPPLVAGLSRSSSFDLWLPGTVWRWRRDSGFEVGRLGRTRRCVLPCLLLRWIVRSPPDLPAGPGGERWLCRFFLAFGVHGSKRLCPRCPSGACWGRRETESGLELRLSTANPSSRLWRGMDAPRVPD